MNDDALDGLRSPRMGTELMGQLLYALARTTRAERVLEIGAGYTTPFLLKALADTRADIAREREAMARKQQRYDPAWADDEDAGRAHEGDVLAWLEADPPLALPSYYEAPYEPRCVSIDDESSPYTAAPRVAEVAEHLGLADLLDRRDGDFRALADDLRGAGERFDLAWFDCGGYPEYRAFIDLYWDLVKPDGGLLVLHYTLTVPNHERVVDELRQEGEDKRGPFEVLSLLEPHKLMQNSCTLVRRCAGEPPRYPLTRSISLERSGR